MAERRQGRRQLHGTKRSHPLGHANVKVGNIRNSPLSHSIALAVASPTVRPLPSIQGAAQRDHRLPGLGGSGNITEEDTSDNTIEFTVTLSRRLEAGEQVEVPLLVSGTGITDGIGGDFANVVLKSGTGLNRPVTCTLSNTNPRNPLLRFKGIDGSNPVQVATCIIDIWEDFKDEADTETLAIALRPDGNSANGFDLPTGQTNVAAAAGPDPDNNSFSVALLTLTFHRQATNHRQRRQSH